MHLADDPLPLGQPSLVCHRLLGGLRLRVPKTSAATFSDIDTTQNTQNG
jgi:hypothetical protein